MFIFERPAGLVRENPKISEKNSFCAYKINGSKTIADAVAIPMLNLISLRISFLKIKNPYRERMMGRKYAFVKKDMAMKTPDNKSFFSCKKQ